MVSSNLDTGFERIVRQVNRGHAPLLATALLAVLSGFSIPASPAEAQSRACPAEMVDALRSPLAAEEKPVEINCDLSLSEKDRVVAPLAFSGGAASNLTLDCHGATLAGMRPGARSVVIRSIHRKDGSWDVPHGIVIRNCTIAGDMRIQGFGANGQSAQVRLSSAKPGHTQRAQESAPSDILIDHVRFDAETGIPLYLSPGVTKVTVQNSHFVGKTSSTAIYLDAESADNRISGSTFDIRTRRREVIAIDSSAGNRIENNRFVDPVRGGIFVYRNCGEGGTVRQQSPEHNTISGNTFDYKRAPSKPAVWLGSRQGFSTYNSYCLTQPGMMLGGIDHNDGANHNSVTDNRIVGGSAAKLIVDNGSENTISGNR